MKILFSTLALALAVCFTASAQDDAGKIALEGNRLFIVVPNYGFSIYDVSLPKTPREIRFVECPGILDIAVRDEYIFASRFEDLYLLKVPKNSGVPDEIVHHAKNVFPSRRRDLKNVDVKPEFFSYFEEFKEDLEERDGVAGQLPKLSANGSMSSVALAGDYLYAVDGDRLRTYLGKPTAPNVLENTSSLEFPGVTLETAWTEGDNRLYLGSQTGLYVVDISNRATPRILGTYEHQFACDPVVVKGNIAYSTLRSGTKCRNTNNELVVVDVSNPGQPTRLHKIDLTNPHGLAVQGNTLLVCDGREGLKVFDISTPQSPRQIAHKPGMLTYDVLFHGVTSMAYVSVPRELHLFSLAQPSNPAFQSKIILPRVPKR